MVFLLFLRLPWGCSNMGKKVWKKIGNLSLRTIAVGIVFTVAIWGLYYLIQNAGYRFDFPRVIRYLPAFNKAMVLTLVIASVSLISATVLGTLVGLARLSSITVLSDTATVYVQVLRNIPLMVIILALYFGLGAVFPKPSALFWGILGLTLYEASYIAEIVRGGIAAIHKEQRESADALGMSYYTKMRHIILPQAFRNIIPALTGQLVMLAKDSSLLMVIGVMELTLQSRYLLSVTFQALEIYVMTSIYYFAICFPLAMGAQYLERRLSLEER